jgi:hypothetical protein
MRGLRVSWAWWILVTVVALSLGAAGGTVIAVPLIGWRGPDAVGGMAGIFAFFAAVDTAAGAAVRLGQWALLRRARTVSPAWIAATALGRGLGAACTGLAWLAITTFPFAVAPFAMGAMEGPLGPLGATRWGPLQAVLGGVQGAVTGTFVGFGQWLSSRRRATRRWIALSVGAWAAGAAAAGFLTGLAPGIGMLLATPMLGLVVGAITAPALGLVTGRD